MYTVNGIVAPKKNAPCWRIISNNILMQSIKPMPERSEGLLAAYEHMDADIFALQEADPRWNTEYNLNVNLGELGYSLVPLNAKDRFPDKLDTQNNNPIYYKTEKFDLVDCGYIQYDVTMLTGCFYNPRWYSWACLKDKESGKQLLVITTHFIWKLTDKSLSPEQNTHYADMYRCESARQIIAFAKKLQEKFPGTPVIATGDFNCNYESEAYAILKSGLTSSRDECEEKVNMEYETCNPLGNIPKVDSKYAFDHIFYSQGITAKHFETLVNPNTYAYSDHVPAMLDFIVE